MQMCASDCYSYEWGYTYGPPMAVAPLNNVRGVLNYAVSAIPREKILMGVPNYGYDWPLPYRQGETKAENIGSQQAVLRAANVGAEIFFDETAQSPYYNYTLNGVRHIVWFEDVRSIRAKLALNSQLELQGAAYWTIMRPFNQNWALISALYRVRKRR